MNVAAARLAAVPRPVAALLALSWAAGIFTLSSLPGAAIGAKGFAGAFAFNLAHAPLFGGLATFVGLALLGRPSIPFPDRGRMLGAFVLVLLYGASDEWHQASVAGRSSDVLDLVTDAGGAWAGVVLAATAVRCAAGGEVRLRAFAAPVALALAGAAAATVRGA